MVMKLHQVQYWFFTSKVNGQILKKRRANSNAREILEAWGKKIRKHPCDLFAYTMHSEEMDGGTHGIHQDHREGKTTVEGHSFATLRELFKGKKHSNGIVQRFVFPKGGKNTVIKAAWSPSMCLVERRVNVHGVTDKRVPMGDRPGVPASGGLSADVWVLFLGPGLPWHDAAKAVHAERR